MSDFQCVCVCVCVCVSNKIKQKKNADTHTNCLMLETSLITTDKYKTAESRQMYLF